MLRRVASLSGDPFLLLFSVMQASTSGVKEIAETTKCYVTAALCRNKLFPFAFAFFVDLFVVCKQFGIQNQHLLFSV